MSLDVTYYKRYRMEISLLGRDFSCPAPKGYELLSWHPSLLDAHAEAKFLSFRHEIDACVFPCLGDYDGCRKLMADIVAKDGFLPEATWLAVRGEEGCREYCGTIQGIRHKEGYGAIQNLGVVPAHRDRGLGTALLCRALAGFQSVGLERACLEVTAQNEGAVRMYRRAGFKKARTVYKVSECAVA